MFHGAQMFHRTRALSRENSVDAGGWDVDGVIKKQCSPGAMHPGCIQTSASALIRVDVFEIAAEDYFANPQCDDEVVREQRQ
jgi:hypothetical protein